MKHMMALFLSLFILFEVSIIGNTITLFFRSYGAVAQNISEEKLKKLVSTPGKLGRYLIKQQMKKNITQGICATYMGDFAVSNIDGSLSFNRKTIRNMFYILVTRMIKPVMLLGATVHHFTVSDNEPYAFYALHYNRDDKDGIFYWTVKKEAIPADKAIPLNTVIIFARPSVLVIPEGASLVQKQLQLIFPDIFVMPQIDRTGNSLRLIAIQHFFSPVRINQKITGKKHEITTITD